MNPLVLVVIKNSHRTIRGYVMFLKTTNHRGIPKHQFWFLAWFSINRNKFTSFYVSVCPQYVSERDGGGSGVGRGILVM